MLTQAQKIVLARLSNNEASRLVEVGHTRDGYKAFRLESSGVRVQGVRIDPIVYERTVNILAGQGWIAEGRRILFGIGYSGYFITPAGTSTLGKAEGK